MYLFFVGITEKEISKVFSNWSNFPGQFHRHYVWYTSLWSNRICLWKRGLFILTIWCFSYIFFPEFGTKTYGKKSFWRLVSSNTNIGRISSRLQTSHDAGTNVAHCVGLSIWLTLISHLFPFNTDMWRSGKSREKMGQMWGALYNVSWIFNIITSNTFLSANRNARARNKQFSDIFIFSPCPFSMVGGYTGSLVMEFPLISHAARYQWRGASNK